MPRKHKNNSTSDTPLTSGLAVSNRMKSVRRTNTKPELAIQSCLKQMGLSFKTDFGIIKGSQRRADIVFKEAKVTVFIDGCFWHGCPIHGTWPKTNSEFWRKKVESNRKRDLDTDYHLTNIGWKVTRVWEHESPTEVADRIFVVIKKGDNK